MMIAVLTGEPRNVDDFEDDSAFKGNLVKGKFLDTDRVVDILMKANDGLKNIPGGLKENVYFIINNEKNISKKENDQKSVFHDDCSVWNSDSGMSPETPYLITGNGHLKKILQRKKDGSAFNEKNDEECGKAYCTERQINKKCVYVPTEPQPNANEVVTI